VEKSKRGKECQKVDGIPPCAKATGLPVTCDKHYKNFLLQSALWTDYWMVIGNLK